MKLLKILKALSDDTRLRLFSLLSRCELNVNEIVMVMQMGQSRISRHLRILSDSGILESRRDGLWTFYRLHRQNGQAGGTTDIPAALFDLLNSEVLGEEKAKSDIRRAGEIIKKRETESRDFFDAVAEEWKNVKQEMLGGKNINRLIHNLIRPCRLLVDCGCGPGDLVSGLLDKVKSIIGVDSSPKMIEAARRLFMDNGNVDFRLGEIEHLPVSNADESAGANESAGADYAVFNLSLHHLTEPLSGIREAFRIIKPGGFLVIADFSKHQFDNFRGKYQDRWLGFRKNEIEQWLISANFKIKTYRTEKINESLSVFLSVSQKTA